MKTHFLNFEGNKESKQENPIGSRLKKNPHGEPADLLKMSVKSKWVHLKLFDGDRAMPHFFEFVLLLGSLLIALLLHCSADCSSATTKTMMSTDAKMQKEKENLADSLSYTLSTTFMQ
ncbi:hypothetical protein C1H46_007294 [Malus baccata]|uniref:Uncharacterized protein n=1 Tax=Malus baccata TaxID=106549 RepID=A0A540N9D3_MALBA|nr:hypothetical protein C1H46_007294 [Malus baccata]